jgi:hypothetical protein
MSLHPAQDEIEAKRKRDTIEKCGKNMGPHDYIPIEWTIAGPETDQVKRVTRFICRVCFCNINTATLIEMYRDISSY